MFLTWCAMFYVWEFALLLCLQIAGDAVLTLSITVLLSTSSPQPLKNCYYFWTCGVMQLALYMFIWHLDDNGNEWNWYIISIFPFPYTNNMHLIYSTNRKWWNSSCSCNTTSYHLYWSHHFGYHGTPAPDCINTTGLLHYKKVSFNTWIHLMHVS